MRCFFMKQGRITAVELLPGLNDEEAIQKSRELFEMQRHKAGYDGFEVWEQARVILQHHPIRTDEANVLPPAQTT